MDMATLNAQTAVVRTFVQLTPIPWGQIVVNLELDEDEEGYHTDCLAFAVVPDDSGYSEYEIRLDRPGRDAIFALHKAMGGEGASWQSFDLVVEPDGAFTFDFSYEAPKRLNGVFDQHSYHRFDHYAAEFAARRAGTG